MMPHEDRIPSKQLLILGGGFIGILSLCWLVATLPSTIAQQRFSDGVAAISAGDCVGGMEIMLQASETLLLPRDKGEDYERRSERYSSLCNDYLIAVRTHENEQYADALIAYHDFVAGHGALGLYDLLSDEIAVQVGLLFDDVSYDQLVNPDSCSLLQEQIFFKIRPTGDVPAFILEHLPFLHAECVRLEIAQSNEADATAHYSILTIYYPDSDAVAIADEPFAQFHYDEMLRAAQNDDPVAVINRLTHLNAEYPNHPLTQEANDEAPQLITVNDGLCLRLRTHTLFDSINNFDLTSTAFAEHIPPLYLDCVENELARSNVDGAQTHYAQLQEDYPDSDVIVTAGEVLAQGYYDAMVLAAEGHSPVGIIDWLTILNEDFPDLPITQQANEEAPQYLISAAREIVVNLDEYEEPIAAIDSAIAALNYMRDHYNDHLLADAAEALLARALVAQADLFAATEITRPLGHFDAEAGTTVLAIANSTPNRLRIALVGPENRVETIEPCRACRVYVNEEPDGCPSSYTEGIYTLVPGDYNIVVSVIDERGITPYRGEWELEGSFTYSHCFFIVREFN